MLTLILFSSFIAIPPLPTELCIPPDVSLSSLSYLLGLSLLLHCVFTLSPLPGGIAGAASRITGAMAKGVAAMTMDEEYQQKRREAMNKQPSGLREGLTRGGKGLVSVSLTYYSMLTPVQPNWCQIV